MHRTYPNLLEEAEAIEAADGAAPADIAAYAADVLGHVLGHAITADTGTAAAWAEYARILWPALACTAPAQFNRAIDAAADICEL